MGIQRLLGPTFTRLGPIPQLRPPLVCGCAAAALIASSAVASAPMNSGPSRALSAADAAPVYRFAATQVVPARQVGTHSIDVDARHRVVMRATYDLPWPWQCGSPQPWQKVLNS